jgi:hypothetical protein
VATATHRFSWLVSPSHQLRPVNRSPLIAFAGGTVVIAVMVLAAFANMAAAETTTCPRSQQQTTSTDG